MRSEIKRLPKSEVELICIVEVSELKPFVKDALKTISQDIEIQGFRKGKAPEEIVRQQVGEMRIYEEAARRAISQFYIQCVNDYQLDPLGEPRVTVRQLAPNNPLEFSVQVAVFPEVTLPDYRKLLKGLSSARRQITVTEAMVADSLEWLRKSRAARTDQTSPVRADDKVTAVKEERQEGLPELNDAFAQSLGKFQTLTDLKQSIREGLTLGEQEKEQQRFRIQILKEIDRQTVCELPDILVNAERQASLQAIRQAIEDGGISWPDYLSQIDKTEAQLQEELLPQAKERVKLALIVEAVAKQERIKVTDEEAKAEADKYLAKYQSLPEAEKINPETLISRTRGILRNEKVSEFLETLTVPSRKPN